MGPSFEEIFLAIAVKNKLVGHPAAVECLSAFKAQASGHVRPIDEIVVARGLLGQEQAAVLANAARKVMAGADSGAVSGGEHGASARTPPVASVKPAGLSDEPIPGYRILRKIGVGGTAIVFEAEDRRHGNRKAAVKVMQPGMTHDEKAVAAFLREAQLLCAFEHPNLVKGYEQGRLGPLVYLVLEYLDGESVEDVLERDKRLSEARALEIILEAAKAIDYMQARGIVHRDIKPGNIMVCRNGRIKLCDLGFALEIGSISAEEEGKTTSGTVQYMSPEQARGQGDIDVRADIYSLGATLYHMVMGELPFTGADSLEVMAKQVMEALNSTEIKNRRISRHMHYFIERMMSKEKELRYGNPRELIDDINEQIEGFRSLEFRPDPSTHKTTRVMRELSQPVEPPATGRRPRTERLRTTTRRLKPPP
ncbi:MAG: serine/threonine protein kinase [Planctomycetes bacterium]|nr:serine/threonine protein kinase [Planctomycetota bacterium]